MKRMASAKKPSRSNASKTRKPTRFAVCIDSDGYEVSLEQHKVYGVIADAKAAKVHMLRVIDETGEDYLFEADRFILIPVPATLATAIRRRTRAAV